MFDETHNLVAFLEKPSESKVFKQIINLLNAKSIRYALTVNPTVYASCVKQFWTTAKEKKVNDQEEIQALVDKQKVIITEESIKRDLKFDDVEDVREQIVEKKVSTADPVTTIGKVVTVAIVQDSVAPTTTTTVDVDDELTLVKTLIAIKASKLKVLSTVITTPRVKGVVFHE
nr:hypothetical protein [Tanacetum cinerariifolium]